MLGVGKLQLPLPSPPSQINACIVRTKSYPTYSLDIYVTTSNLPSPNTLTSTTPASMYALFETHSMAPFLALKYAPAAMKKTTPKGTYANAAPKDAAYGSIIVVTSAASSPSGGSSNVGPGFTIASYAALGVVRGKSPGTVDRGTKSRLGDPQGRDPRESQRSLRPRQSDRHSRPEADVLHRSDAGGCDAGGLLHDRECGSERLAQRPDENGVQLPVCAVD